MTNKLIISALIFSSFTAHAIVPNQALTFDTNVKVVNGTSSQEAKIQSAEEIIKKIVASDKFRDAVLNFTYNGKKSFVDNGGYSNAQIYQKLLDGAETLQPAKNNAMDIEVEIYTNNWTSTVGYTTPSTKRIFVNTKFFNTYNAGEVAHNLVHEWTHKLGFDHASNWSTSRDYSVPYGIGSIILKLAKDSEVMGTGSGSSGSGSTTTTLTAPSNLKLTKTTTKVTLSWTKSTSSAGISTYKVYRVLAGSTTAYLQGSTTSLAYTQTKPTNNASYYVKAVDKNGKTINSTKVSFTK